MVGRYQGYVIDAVRNATRRNETLHVRETARSIAAAARSPHLLDAIADALVQEGIRQRTSIEMRQSRTPRPS